MKIMVSVATQMDITMTSTVIEAAGTNGRLAYTIAAAAEALAISRSRLYELIADGQITACKVGKRTIIQAAELTAFLHRHRVERLSGQKTATDPIPHGGRADKLRR